jgi:hypothetical protein
MPPKLAPKPVKPYDMASGQAQLFPELFSRYANVLQLPTLTYPRMWARTPRRVWSRYVDSHRESKEYIARHRPRLADNRNIANFSMPFKDAIHPIVCERAEGPYVWDKDGNKVIDMGGGFGPVLFGHNPPFVRDAVCDMMRCGSCPQTRAMPQLVESVALVSARQPSNWPE